jgi:hypothetical protein
LGRIWFRPPRGQSLPDVNRFDTAVQYGSGESEKNLENAYPGSISGVASKQIEHLAETWTSRTVSDFRF